MTTTPKSANAGGLPKPSTLLHLLDYVQQTIRFSEGLFLAGLGISDEGDKGGIVALVLALNERLDFIAAQVEEMRTGGRS